MPNTLVRLVGQPVPGHALELDDNALRRRRQHEMVKVRRMVGYANARQCRRQKILGYFGETWDKPNCAACDHCLSGTGPKNAPGGPARTPSEGEWLNVQKILSCVARMRGRYGRTRVVQVLQGSRAREIRDTHLSQLSTYGILKGAPREMIDGYLEALIGDRLHRHRGGRIPEAGNHGPRTGGHAPPAGYPVAAPARGRTKASSSRGTGAPASNLPGARGLPERSRRWRLNPTPLCCNACKRCVARWRRPSPCPHIASSRTAPCRNWRSGSQRIPTPYWRFTGSVRRRLENMETFYWKRFGLTWRLVGGKGISRDLDSQCHHE